MKLIEELQILETVEADDLQISDPKNDKVDIKTPSDAPRRPKLTLKAVNKLKKLRAIKNIENAQEKKIISMMYGASKTQEDDSGL